MEVQGIDLQYDWAYDMDGLFAHNMSMFREHYKRNAVTLSYKDVRAFIAEMLFYADPITLGQMTYEFFQDLDDVTMDV